MQKQNLNFSKHNLKTVVFVSTLSFNDKNTAGYNRILNYAKALACNKINVILFSLSDKFQNASDLEQIVENIYIIKRKNTSYSAWNSLISLNRLRESIYGKVSYVFYPSSRFTADLIFIASLKILSSKKIFCEINELRYTYVENRFKPENPFTSLFVSLKNALDLFFYKVLEYSYLKYDGLISISSSLNNYLLKYNSNIIRIPILVEVPQERFYCSLPIVEYFKIGFFGTISFKKEGLINIIQAIKKLCSKNCKVKFYLYGSISEIERKALQHYIQKEEVQDLITYLGIIPHERILIEMRKMNLLILPRPLNCQTNFGFSTKLAEYLISGVPVLVTNVSDNSHYIKDGFNGFMVDDISSDGFESKIAQIMKNYDQVKFQISIAGYETAVKHFDYQLYKDKLTEFLFLYDK